MRENETELGLPTEQDHESGAEIPAKKGKERRVAPRFELEENARLTLLFTGSPTSCKVLDVSLDGCQLRSLERFTASIGMRVEVTFRVNGIAFRLSGAIQWTDGSRMVGIRFVEMTQRRIAEWGEVIREVEEDLAKRAAQRQAAEKQAAEAAEAAKAAPAAPAPQKGGRRERRTEARHEVDTSAVILLVNLGSKINGRILDLSPEGCRIRVRERFPVGIYTRVETEFRIAGEAVRLGGVVQAIYDASRDGGPGEGQGAKRREVGIRFLDLSQRKREQVRQLIDEIEEMRAHQSVASA